VSGWWPSAAVAALKAERRQHGSKWQNIVKMQSRTMLRAMLACAAPVGAHSVGGKHQTILPDIEYGSCMDFSERSQGLKVLGALLPIFVFGIPFIFFALWYCIRLKTDRETAEPSPIDISKGGSSPSFCCSAGGHCTWCELRCYWPLHGEQKCDMMLLRSIWTKPEENLVSWFKASWLYTWPFNPRDTNLTLTDRKTIMWLVIWCVD
jgi:hypothetical protein